MCLLPGCHDNAARSPADENLAPAGRRAQPRRAFSVQCLWWRRPRRRGWGRREAGQYRSRSGPDLSSAAASIQYCVLYGILPTVYCTGRYEARGNLHQDSEDGGKSATDCRCRPAWLAGLSSQCRISASFYIDNVVSDAFVRVFSVCVSSASIKLQKMCTSCV